MRDNKGQFVKGERSHPETEFKKGEHWRLKKPHWDRVWLFNEYITEQRSAQDIAKAEGCTEAAILFWLRKHNIPRRKMTEIRRIKRWGLSGELNPMWNGGTSTERQTFYNSLDWAWAIKTVYGRDNKSCQRCGKHQTKPYGQFHIHHRITFSERDLRLNIDNLVLLCIKCHHWVHSKRNKSKMFIGSYQVSIKEVMNNGGEVLLRP